jgi:RNA polymerase sigma-54 factor
LLQGGQGPDKDYIQEKARSAQWLLKSLQQRQKTLYKVMESIVRFQQDFFRHGVTKLKPLVLKDVAEDIGMHESTVSRITSNKYVATPHGVFELKFFFNSGLSMDDGSEVGSESVKAIIKQLVSEEDPAHPLSDEKIAAVLKERLDINIARRTVAKYRALLGIESSSRRRRIL